MISLLTLGRCRHCCTVSCQETRDSEEALNPTLPCDNKVVAVTQPPGCLDYLTLIVLDDFYSL